MIAGSRWLTELDPNSQSIDWPSQGDPLVEYLRNEISFPITLSSWAPVGYEESRDPFTSYGHVLYSDNLDNRLVFAYLSDGIRVLVETPSKPESGRELEPWRSAYDRARRRLLEALPEFLWWAAIGPHPGRVSDVPKVVRGATIRNISVSPARNPYTEGLDTRINPHLAGATIYSSYPLYVCGKTAGYSRDAAKERATEELNLVCALLSLEFDSYWSIRSSVEAYSADEADEFPEVELPQWSFGLSEERIAGGPGLGNVREVTIPSWVSAAFEEIEKNSVLYSAVHAHRQGLAVAGEHPSLALICFVSAIEGIGSTLEELTSCSCCGAKKGAQKRFRKALKTVFSNKESKEFESIYTLRSQTAHSGALHGNEVHMGNLFMPMNVFAPQPKSFEFRYRSLWRLQDASKRVLIEHLSV